MPTAALAMPGKIRGGNRTTALRWARILRGLGWHVQHSVGWDGRPCDLLIALHARRTHGAVVRFHAAHPDRPIVVAATGTDLYSDLAGGGNRGDSVRDSFAIADRIVLLQELALGALPAEYRSKARVILQSLPTPSERPPIDPEIFEVSLLANLRPVKDPLLAIRAVEALPADTRVVVTHLGSALDPALGESARRASQATPRYRWLGGRPRAEALKVLARSRLMLSTSRAEGGSNVVTEAFAVGVGVLSTAVEGAVGLLGEDHPGLFPVGDATACARLLERAEADPEFLAELTERSRERAWMTEPQREIQAWRELLAELL